MNASLVVIMNTDRIASSSMGTITTLLSTTKIMAGTTARPLSSTATMHTFTLVLTLDGPLPPVTTSPLGRIRSIATPYAPLIHTTTTTTATMTTTTTTTTMAITITTMRR